MTYVDSIGFKGISRLNLERLKFLESRLLECIITIPISYCGNLTS